MRSTYASVPSRGSVKPSSTAVARSMYKRVRASVRGAGRSRYRSCRVSWSRPLAYSSRSALRTPLGGRRVVLRSVVATSALTS